MQSKYFFSYSRIDSDFVKRLATDLKKAGANVWLDQLDIAPGNPWDDSIQNALNEAQGLIVILSIASSKSKNVLDEVSYAMNQGKKIVPLMIENCTVPFRLARFQYIDFIENYDTPFQQLLKTLNTSKDSLAQPSTSEENFLSELKSKKSSSKPFILAAIITVVAFLIGFVLLKNNKGTADTTTTGLPNRKTEQHNETNNQLTNSGEVAELPSQNVEQNAAANNSRINLFAPESSAQVLVASSDDWKYSIDGKEDEFNSYAGEEAVYGFKDDRSATFDAFAILITKTENTNVKEFELLAGNDTPLGSFQSIGKFNTQNIRLFKTPYQEFKFKAVTAKYLKFKLLSTYNSGTHIRVREFQLFGSLQ